MPKPRQDLVICDLHSKVAFIVGSSSLGVSHLSSLITEREL